MRLVLIIITYLLFIPAGNTADFSKYKSTCSDIGFTPDTDPFADCVLKLYKRDRVKVKDQVNQKEEIDRQAERQRQANTERDKERQAERQRQANYERERLRIQNEILAREQEIAEREDNRRRSLMLLNLGQNLLNPPQPAPKMRIRCRDIGNGIITCDEQ
jgi:hypothetical protein